MKTPTITKPLLSTETAMKLLGYRSKWGFLRFVHQQGVPHIRLNASRIMFDQTQLDEWLASRRSPSLSK
jgi:predicted DNA-binding transcriptional regulator AlpA